MEVALGLAETEKVRPPRECGEALGEKKLGYTELWPKKTRLAGCRHLIELEVQPPSAAGVRQSEERLGERAACTANGQTKLTQ